MLTAQYNLSLFEDLDSSTASTCDGASHLPPEALPLDENWWLLVDRIRAGESAALEELYNIFSKGIRFYLCRQLGPQELDDKVHDTFLIVVQTIQKGELRDPERLMGFVRTIVRRQVAAHIDEVVHLRKEKLDVDTDVTVPDRRRNPEEKAIGLETENLMVRVLRSMAPRDREILTRFYIKEQTQEQICEEMGLTSTQFRLLKSRAKARFGALGRKRTEKKPPERISLRTFSSFFHQYC
jgi:RNA polymerase sigma factor (sigma-70 family)